MATDTSTYGQQVANTLLGGFQTGMQLGGMLQQARLAIRQQQLNEARFGLQQRQMVLEEANFQRKQQEFMMETEKWNLSKTILNQQIQANNNLTEVQKAEAQNRLSMALQTQKAQLQWQKFSPDVADALQSDAVQRMQAFTEGKAPPTNERLTQLYRLMPEVMASEPVQEMIKARNDEVSRFMMSYRMTHQGRVGGNGGSVRAEDFALWQDLKQTDPKRADLFELYVLNRGKQDESTEAYIARKEFEAALRNPYLDATELKAAADRYRNVADQPRTGTTDTSVGFGADPYELFLQQRTQGALGE